MTTTTRAAVLAAFVMALIGPGGPALAQTGTIGGKVTSQATGTGLAGVKVFATDNIGHYGEAFTDGAGGYSLTGLTPSSYYVHTSNSAGYVDELYDNLPCPSAGCGQSGGTKVNVSAGAAVGGIDFALDTGGHISGRVTDSGTGLGIAAVEVNVHRFTGGSYQWAGRVTTDGTGHYTLVNGLPTGVYYVWTSNSAGYADELFDDVPCAGGNCTFSTGTSVNVTLGATATGVDFALAKGGSISGRVTDEKTGSGLGGVDVVAYRAVGQSWEYAGAALTDATGAYSITRLAPGTCYVFTSETAGHLDELYDNLPCPGGNCAVTAGTPVSVAAGGTTSGIDFALATGGSISGRVTDAATGTGLEVVQVFFYRATGDSYTYNGSDYTDKTGAYTSPGLATGSYYVHAQSYSGNYVQEIYRDLPCPLGVCMVLAGTPVSVTVGETKSGIDFALVKGAGNPAGSEWLNFDGDERTDVAVYRPSTGQWYVLPSSTDFSAGWTPATFGSPAQGDVPLLGDFDGDGRRDCAVYRPGPGTWFWLKSSLGNAEFEWKGWGMQARGDQPVPGDYDGDGRTDPTVYRPASGTWFILRSDTNYTQYWALGWGQGSDVPMPGDYDGDGRTDVAVYRPSTGEWFVRPAAADFTSPWAPRVFGQAGDTPVRGDFDGDGKRDFAVYRPTTGTWFWLESATSYTGFWSRGWGVQAQGDVPVPGDYDGDGRTDPTVYRPAYGTWYILRSGSGYAQYWMKGWGQPTDTPLGGAR